MHPPDDPPDLDRTLHRAFRYAMALTHHRDRAEDLVQDACASVARSGAPWTVPYLLRAGSSYAVAGGGACELADTTAISVHLLAPSGGACTMYQFAECDDLGAGIERCRVTVDGLEVEFWRESGVYVAMTR